MDEKDLFLHYLEIHPPDDKDASAQEGTEPVRTDARLDLHGFTALDAGAALRRKLEECRRAGITTLRVITGKGIHSRTGKAVLRDSLSEGLNHGRFGKIRSFRRGKAKEGGSGVLVIRL